jgi:hypothetical protein
MESGLCRGWRWPDASPNADQSDGGEALSLNQSVAFATDTSKTTDAIVEVDGGDSPYADEVLSPSGGWW